MLQKTKHCGLLVWARLLPSMAAVVATLSCGSGDITQPDSAILEITTSTTGAEPDANGYIMQMDADRTQVLQPAGTFRSADVSPGNHIIQLAGVAANCSVAGANPRSITVSAGATSSISFEVTCRATISSLQVSSTTRGPSPDADGYRISIDGTDQGTLGASDAVTLGTVAPGDHRVGLSGVTGNCQVEGDNPREVAFTAGESISAAFEVSCAAPPSDAGTLRITTTTAGGDPDANGYVVTLDGEASQPIGLDASITLDNLTAGSHTLELSDLAENCSLVGGNPRSATVSTGITAETNFAITCSIYTGTMQVSVTTTGTSLDPDGYWIDVEGPTQSVATNGAVTFTGVPSGTRIVQLGDVSANCSVADGTGRSVTVTAGGRSEVGFVITCELGRGSIEVTVATSGWSFVTGGYTVAVDGGPPTAIGPNGSQRFGELPPGLHRIELAGLPSNCHTDYPNPWDVTVVAGGGVNTVIAVSCSSGGGADSWTEVAPMLEPRSDLAVGVVPDAAGRTILYAIGGDGTGPVVQAYDPVTDAWQSRRSPPLGFSGFTNGVGVINGLLYISGGYGEVSRKLFVYNPGNDSWSEKAALPIRSASGVSGVIDGKLYVLTGTCATTDPAGECPLGATQRLYRYDPSTDEWTRLTDCPNKHVSGAGGVVQGRFYVAGGQDLGPENPMQYSNKLDVYDPVTDTWASLSPMPTGRVNVASAILGDKVYILGGDDGSTVFDIVEAYDPIADVWTTRAPLLMARSRHGAGVIRNAAGGLRLLALGGGDRGVVGLLATVEAYTP